METVQLFFCCHAATPLMTLPYRLIDTPSVHQRSQADAREWHGRYNCSYTLNAVLVKQVGKIVKVRDILYHFYEIFLTMQ